MKVTAEVFMGKDGRFTCYVPVEFENFGLAGYGDSAESAKNDMLSAYSEIKEMDASVPDLEFSFKYDLQSFFNIFSFLKVSKIAELSGINASQMRQYASGCSTASEMQYIKVRKAIAKIKKQFDSAVL